MVEKLVPFDVSMVGAVIKEGQVLNIPLKSVTFDVFSDGTCRKALQVENILFTLVELDRFNDGIVSKLVHPENIDVRFVDKEVSNNGISCKLLQSENKLFSVDPRKFNNGIVFNDRQELNIDVAVAFDLSNSGGILRNEVHPENIDE
jgi:hypothetical protein